MHHALALALLLFSTASSRAQEPKNLTAAPPATRTDATAAPELTALSQTLTRRQKDKEQGRAAPEGYTAFIGKFRTELDQTYSRVPRTPANDALYARILTRLGDSGRALTNIDSALARDQKNTALLSAKASALFERKDYAGAAAAANTILRERPNDKEALWLKHASEDRAAPDVHLPGSPWETRPDLTSAVVRPAAAAPEDARPATLAVKIRSTAAPPAPNAAEPAPAGAPGPDRKALAAGALGTLMLAGSGLLMLGDKTKMFVEDHPYITAAGVAAAAVVAVVVVVGTGGGAAAGGGGLMLAAANGAPVAAAGAAAAGVTATDVAVGGAAVATTAGIIYMNAASGDSSKKSSGSTGGGSPSKRKITFGTDHAKPHFESTGLDQSTIEDAIRKDLEKQFEQGPSNVKGPFNGRINFAGRTIEYRGYGLPNGDINIGTYYQP